MCLKRTRTGGWRQPQRASTRCCWARVGTFSSLPTPRRGSHSKSHPAYPWKNPTIWKWQPKGGRGDLQEARRGGEQFQIGMTKIDAETLMIKHQSALRLERFSKADELLLSGFGSAENALTRLPVGLLCHQEQRWGMSTDTQSVMRLHGGEQSSSDPYRAVLMLVWRSIADFSRTPPVPVFLQLFSLFIWAALPLRRRWRRRASLHICCSSPLPVAHAGVRNNPAVW